MNNLLYMSSTLNILKLVMERVVKKKSTPATKKVKLRKKLKLLKLKIQKATIFYICMCSPNQVYRFDEENMKRIEQLKCRICDNFARDPIYICTHEKWREDSTIFCCECYEQNCKRNKKPSGACIFDHFNRKGLNEDFVQRYDCLIDPKSEVK